MGELKPPEGAVVIAIAGVIGIALIGFVRATSAGDYDLEGPLSREVIAVAHADTPVARPYWEMRRTPPPGGLADLEADLALLRQQIPARTDALDRQTTLPQDLAARAARRAYHGAPPVIPHPVRQSSAGECVTCHDLGLRIGNRRAPQFPHRELTSCTQCHAMAVPNPPWVVSGDDPRDVVNSFVGLDAPKHAPRWTSIAPPSIPHDTFMHERCDSCHGVNGRDALRTPHTERQNCEQCHAPQSEEQWRPGGLR